MSQNVYKPRLSHYRGLLSYDNPDIHTIVEGYTDWVSQDEYLIFRRENVHTFEKDWKAVKASKRGNDVYVNRVKNRLRHLSSIPDVKCFDYNDRSKRHKTRVLFVTLTYRRDDPLNVVWDKVGVDFNRYVAGLKRRYGRKILIIRTFEAQRDGYVHIHAVLYFQEYEFETFFYNGRWRITERDDVIHNWHWGFCDVLALYSLKAGVGYVTKYITKIQSAVVNDDEKYILTLALLWVFRKRAFSVSRGFSMLILVEKRVKSYHGQVDLHGNPLYRWYLIGFWFDLDGSFDCWSKDLSHKEFFSIYRSRNFSLNMHLM